MGIIIALHLTRLEQHISFSKKHNNGVLCWSATAQLQTEAESIVNNLLRDCETTKQTQDARSLKADAHNNNCKRNITLIPHYPNQPTIKVL